MTDSNKKHQKPKVKFRNTHNNKKINYKWVITITIITFFVAIVLGYASLVMMDLLSLVGAVAILFVIVFMGIFFDLLGIAVANFFNDVIGDIAGIISGSASAAIIIKMNLEEGAGSTLASIILTAVIAAVTVGGKAVGKEIALRHANYIVYRIGQIMSLVKR